MILNYNFEKKIKIHDGYYLLELKISHTIPNFYYKIYGNSGFIQHGRYSCNKNICLDNILIFTIDKLQNIFINIKYGECNEYFDFLNMDEILNGLKSKQNIKLDIKRKIDNVPDQSNIILDNVININKEIEKNTLFNYFNKDILNKSDSDEDDEKDDDDEEDDEDDDEKDEEEKD